MKRSETTKNCWMKIPENKERMQNVLDKTLAEKRRLGKHLIEMFSYTFQDHVVLDVLSHHNYDGGFKNLQF